LFILPESPRFLVKKGDVERARQVLSRLRDQPIESEYVEMELSELIAYQEYENQAGTATGFFESYFQCFTGSLFDPASNLRRTMVGTWLQGMQQLTGGMLVLSLKF
jgi:MFS transporter, SP family, sugar:H+ symporter